MRVTRSLLVAALAGLCALAFAGAAEPAGARTVLEVFQSPTRAGAATEVDFTLSLANGSPATAKTSFYVPPGYVANLSLPSGTKLGTVAADFLSGANRVAGSGSVTTDDPARHVADACAPGTHAAVWLLSLTLGGRPVTIPLYVDPATPDLAAKAAYVLTACFDTPTASGRQLSDLDVDVTRAFTNPRSPGNFIWRALVTPYAADVPNPAGTTEMQARVPLPHRVTLHARYDRRHGRVVVSGTVTAAGRREPKVPVAIYTTASPGKVAPKRIGIAQTNARGVFTFTHALRKTTFVFAIAPERIYKAGDCETTLGPAPCENETLASSEPAVARVKV